MSIMAIKLHGQKAPTFLGGDTSPPFGPTEYTRTDLIPEPHAIARAALEKAAERITDAVWLEYRDSIENKWVFRKEHVDNAIRRALMDPAALAEIVKGTPNDY
jgi:hypothetical protein